MQLPVGPKDPARFAAIAASDLFEPGAMTAAPGPEDAGEGLSMAGAVVARPGAILARWLGETVPARVATLERGAGGWRLLDAAGALLGQAQIVCVAAAMSR